MNDGSRVSFSAMEIQIIDATNKCSLRLMAQPVFLPLYDQINSPPLKAKLIEINPCINTFSDRNDIGLSGDSLSIGGEGEKKQVLHILPVLIPGSKPGSIDLTCVLDAQATRYTDSEERERAMKAWGYFHASYTYMYNIFGRDQKSPIKGQFNPGAYLWFRNAPQKFCTVMSHRWAQLQHILESETQRLANGDAIGSAEPSQRIRFAESDHVETFSTRNSAIVENRENIELRIASKNCGFIVKANLGKKQLLESLDKKLECINDQLAKKICSTKPSRSVLPEGSRSGIKLYKDNGDSGFEHSAFRSELECKLANGPQIHYFSKLARNTIDAECLCGKLYVLVAPEIN